MALAVFTALSLATTSPQSALATPALNAITCKGVYVGSEFYAPTVTWQNIARSSGFTRLFIFTLSVDSVGNITGFNTTLCSNGSYTGDPTWGSKLAACKSNPSSTSVDRIEIVLGGWNSPAFGNIKSLVASQGTGTGSILYKNFLALINATGVDAIQFDDEGTYDVGSMVAFGNMLAGMGVKVTLCPYTNQGFWVNVKSQLGSAVDAIYLQCYDGGQYNDPINWNNAFGGGTKVIPGLWGNTDSTMSVMNKMRGWNAAMNGMNGGFMWLNGNLPSDGGYQWSEALKLGMEMPYFIIRNRNTGMCLDLANANTSDGAPVQLYNYNYNDTAQRWAIIPTDGSQYFKLISYVAAKCIDVVGASQSDNALVESRTYYKNHHDQEWAISDAGDGCFYIQNVHSGKVLTATGSSNFDPVYQLVLTPGDHTQEWKLIPQGDYFINTFANNKYVNIYGGGTADGSGIVQYNWQDQNWFKWSFVNEVYGWFGVFSKNATQKTITVPGGSTAAGTQLQLWQYSGTDWQKVSISPQLNGTYKFNFKNDGMSWDVGGGSMGNNATINQYPNTANAWQYFKIERVHE